MAEIGAKAMPRRVWIVAMALLVLVDAPGVCHAEMLGVGLSDTARARLQGISFFGACALLCTWAIRRLWNSLADDFPRLPRLSTGNALGAVVAWGFLATSVLMLASGGRMIIAVQDEFILSRNHVAVEGSVELARREVRLEQARRDRLEALATWLWNYAKGHAGKFPDNDQVPEIPPEVWQLPDPSGMRYLYVKGQIAKGATSILAYEPGIFGKERLVLMTDGSIREMGIHELEAISIRGAK